MFITQMYYRNLMNSVFRNTSKCFKTWEEKKKEKKKEKRRLQSGTRSPLCIIFAGGRKNQLNEVREATLVTAAKCELYVIISLTLRPF